MAIRRNIGGRYVEVRERSTSKGHKGTIMGNWSSKNKVENNNSIKTKNIVALIIVILLIMMLIYYFLF